MAADVFGLKNNGMKNHWRKVLSFLPAHLEMKYYQEYFKKEHVQWKSKGETLPVSNFSKHAALREYQKKYHLKTLVETGTYLGDTLYSLSNDFDNLYSIELAEYYFKRATKRFKNMPQVHLLHGDSGTVLKSLVPTLDAPALFWLDGHYSGGLTAKGEKECPVYEELYAIFKSPLEHIIFIDDARLFIGNNDYPTLQEMEEFVKKEKPSYHFFVENDCIRLIPADN
jgi:hypothetical protein